MVAKAAFAAMGHELIVDVFPWSRAVKMVKQGQSKYAGYFPEYYHQSDSFIFSAPAGSGPLGLIEHAQAPIEFFEIDDLRRYKIGIVQDYVNTQAFDQLVAEGEISVQRVMTDEMNIFKLANQRIDAAVIDINVFNYLITHDKKYHHIKDQIKVHRNLLENKALYIAFNADDRGKKWLDIYNKGLAKIQVESLFKNYFTHLHEMGSGTNKPMSK